MTDAPELKPCPFCGCGASILDGDIHGNYVECNACEAALGRDDGMYEINGDFDGIGDAFRAWNTRADLAKPRVKPLVWTHHPCGEIAANGTGSAYIIDKRDKPRLRWMKWPNGHGPERKTVDEMKAAAQADYEVRVLECME